MQQFIIEPGTFKKTQRRSLIVMGVIITVVVVAFVMFTSRDEASLMLMPYYSVFLLLMMSYSMYRAVSKQMVLLQSYKLTVTDSQLIREKLGTPTVTIPFDDVSTISKRSDGSFMVKARRSNTDLYIPPQMNNYNELEVVLNGIDPINVEERSLSQQLSANIMLAVAMLGLMACVWLADNKVLVGASGVLLFGLTFFSFFKLQLNRALDKQMKRSSFLMLVMLIIIAVIVWRKLTA